jgi:hypothetical protein
MTKMHITKTADDRYHVEHSDPLIHEELNGAEFLGMASGRTSPTPAVEILRLMDSQLVGYTMTVDYDEIEPNDSSPFPRLSYRRPKTNARSK